MAWVLLILSVAACVATVMCSARSKRLRRRAGDPLDIYLADGMAGGGEFNLLLLPGLLLPKRAQRVLAVALTFLVIAVAGLVHILVLIHPFAEPPPRLGLSDFFMWAGSLFLLLLSIAWLTFVAVQMLEARRIRRVSSD